MTVWFNINSDWQWTERQTECLRGKVQEGSFTDLTSSYFTPLSSTQGKVSNIERKWGKGRCVHVCIYKTGHGHGSSTQTEGGVGEFELEASLSTQWIPGQPRFHSEKLFQKQTLNKLFTWLSERRNVQVIWPHAQLSSKDHKLYECCRKKKTFNELIIMQVEKSHWGSTPIIRKLHFYI